MAERWTACLPGFVLIITLFTDFIPSSQAYSRDYCDDEPFRAQCSRNGIVMVTSAEYGRMAIGRCVSRDLGYLGCSTPVIGHMDTLCSGRRECEIPDLSKEFEEPSACRELKNYLKADYKCVEVLAPPRDQCQANSPLYAPPAPGHLANLVTMETGCGGQKHPWRLEVEKEFRINITLLDFGYTANAMAGSSGGSRCTRYATVRERGEETSICGGQEREHHMYISKSNVVEVSLLSPTQTGGKYFILKYEAVGCGEPEHADDMWLQHKHDHVTIGCFGSKTTWRLECRDGIWHGEVGNCSGVAGAIPPDTTTPSNSFSWDFFEDLPGDVAIYILVAVGILILLIIVILGMWCHRIRQRNKRRSDVYELALQHGRTPNAAQGMTPDMAMVVGRYNQMPHNFPTLPGSPKYAGRPLPPVSPETTPLCSINEDEDLGQSPYSTRQLPRSHSFNRREECGTMRPTPPNTLDLYNRSQGSASNHSTGSMGHTPENTIDNQMHPVPVPRTAGRSHSQPTLGSTQPGAHGSQSPSMSSFGKGTPKRPHVRHGTSDSGYNSAPASAHGTCQKDLDPIQVTPVRYVLPADDPRNHPRGPDEEDDDDLYDKIPVLSFERPTRNPNYDRLPVLPQPGNSGIPVHLPQSPVSPTPPKPQSHNTPSPDYQSLKYPRAPYNHPGQNDNGHSSTTPRPARPDQRHNSPGNSPGNDDANAVLVVNVHTHMPDNTQTQENKPLPLQNGSEARDLDIRKPQINNMNNLYNSHGNAQTNNGTYKQPSDKERDLYLEEGPHSKAYHQNKTLPIRD